MGIVSRDRGSLRQLPDVRWSGPIPARSRLIVLSCVLGLASPSARAALTTTRNTDRVILQRSGRTITATAWPGSLVGPQTRLALTPNGVRGVLGGVPLDLRWERAHLVGEIAGESVDVQVTHAQERATARGTVAGLPVDLELTPAAIHASYRSCTAILELAGTEYVGSRRCGSTSVPEKLSLEFPAAVGQLDDTQQSALLLALLVTGAR